MYFLYMKGNAFVFYVISADWKNSHRNCVRGWHTHGKIRSQLRAPLSPSIPQICDIYLTCFMRGLNWSPMMPRDASLSDGYTPSICFRASNLQECEKNLLLFSQNHVTQLQSFQQTFVLASNYFPRFDDKLKMARQTEKIQKEYPVRCTGEGKR